MDLSRAENPTLAGQRGILWQLAWYVTSVLLFESAVHLPYRFKSWLLRCFGADIGAGAVIKPRVRIKYPWFLKLGANVWIGECVWIDNLCEVIIGDNVCLSQGCYILTGNHDYRSITFRRFTRSVAVHDGCWIGAQSIVCPGSVLGAGTVLAAGSVLSGRTEDGAIYRGNPAIQTGWRNLGVSNARIERLHGGEVQEMQSANGD